jgi:cobalt-zinc-cadmium efflux system outer membrane protein
MKQSEGGRCTEQRPSPRGRGSFETHSKQTLAATIVTLLLVAPLAAQAPILVPPPARTSHAADHPSAPTTSMTLDDLQQLAQQYNPTLEQARAEILRADGKRIQVGRYPNPTVGYTVGELGQDGKAGQQGFFVSQQLITGGKLRLARDEATFRQLQSEQVLSAQEYRVANSVRREFYSILAAVQMRNLARELVTLVRDAQTIVENRRKLGVGTEVDLLQIQVEIERARLLLNRAEYRYEAAWSRLQAVVGTRELKPSPLVGSLTSDVPDLTWDNSLEKLLELSPQLSRARLGADRARTGLARAEAKPIPNITVQAGSQYDFATRTQIVNLQIGFPLPIRNRNRGNIAAAEAEWIAATRETERIELWLQRSLADAYRQYATNRTRALRYHNVILPAAKEAREKSLKLFDAAELDFTQLYTVQRLYAATQVEYVESLERLWHSIVAIDGLLLKDGLSRPRSAFDDR